MKILFHYKIKSPSYVAIHHLRGEGLCPKKIAELILINETDEYLNISQKMNTIHFV